MSEVSVIEETDRRFIRKNEIIVDERQHNYIKEELGEEIYSELTWISTKHEEDVPRLHGVGSGLANAYKINSIRRINKFMEKANRGLDHGQYFVITMETKEDRKKRLLNKYPLVFSLPYYCLDFILKRVFPKIRPTRHLYFLITKGRNRVLSLTEGLARLVCCGFEIVDFRNLGNLTCIISRKIKAPAYDMQPTYSAFINLNRVGKGGKMIQVFKLRTMYPYSEYLQEYVFAKHNLQKGGKFKNDFRTTSWGRIFRKYWIDELPMFINWFKGEVKLVGVRPLSRHYFELYPKDLQELRIKVKPGLVPPYYADMPKDLEEIEESERKYLIAYEKNPFLTDVRYFFKAMLNIFFRSARSK